MASTNQAVRAISSTSTARGGGSIGQAAGKGANSSRKDSAGKTEEPQQQRKKRNRPKKRRGKGGDRGADTAPAADGTSVAAGETLLGAPPKQKQKQKQKAHQPHQPQRQQHNDQTHRYRRDQHPEEHPPRQPVQRVLHDIPAPPLPEAQQHVTRNTATSAPGNTPSTKGSESSGVRDDHTTLGINKDDDDGRSDQISPSRIASAVIADKVIEKKTTKPGRAKEGIEVDEHVTRVVDATTNSSVAPFESSWTIAPGDSFNVNGQTLSSQAEGPTATSTGELR